MLNVQLPILNKFYIYKNKKEYAPTYIFRVLSDTDGFVTYEDWDSISDIQCAVYTDTIADWHSTWSIRNLNTDWKVISLEEAIELGYPIDPKELVQWRKKNK